MRSDYLATWDPLLLATGARLFGEEVPPALRACFSEGKSVAVLDPAHLSEAQAQVPPGGKLLVRQPQRLFIRSLEGFALEETFGSFQAPGFSYLLLPLRERRMLRFCLSRRLGLRGRLAWLLSWVLPSAWFAEELFLLMRKK